MDEPYDSYDTVTDSDDDSSSGGKSSASREKPNIPEVYRYVSEVLEPEYFASIEWAIYNRFLKECKKLPNKRHFLTKEMKHDVRVISLKRGNYNQIIKIKRKTLASYSFKFQGQTI